MSPTELAYFFTLEFQRGSTRLIMGGSYPLQAPRHPLGFASVFKFYFPPCYLLFTHECNPHLPVSPHVNKV